jgi:leucyl-tRNA synthetase
MEYNFREVEKKWQEHWAKNKTYKTENSSSKPKYYVLDMFPYPSGAGLHVGHPLGYIASDIFARYKRLKGFNVLHPMGYDSFGLPAEQYAIQTGQHPEITTKTNIARYREQLDKIGFSFDWDREVRTSDPSYYKWTQWIFIQLFNCWYNKKTNKAEKIETLVKTFETTGFKGTEDDILTGDLEVYHDGFTAEEWSGFSEATKEQVLQQFRLAYLSDTMVNWCPQLGTVLANEEVKDGVSERGGYPVERKLMKQWSLRITAYADRLLNDLEGIDWTESIKEAQRNWIGKSVGTSIRFSLTPGPSPKERDNTPGYQTANKAIWERLKSNSRENRKNQTEAEELLWEQVRDRKLGYKIRRQHAVDQFIADFICLEQKLIIEVDGEIHNYQQEYDEGRTYLLEEIGYRVIRFTNNSVKENINWVCDEIAKALQSPLSFGEGAGGEAFVEVFTTRPDTVFGVSFVTLAPEHELVAKITTDAQRKAVEEYVTFAKNRSERERMADVKKITGVFTGAYVAHPFTGKKVPVWIGDYVLAGYGTGAVMAVPAHDSRDFAFAKHFGLDITQVILPPSPLEKGPGDEAYEAKEGKLVNSDFLDGLEVKAAIKKAIAVIEEKGLGKGKTNFRLRDAIFGRQRYWGEPIPVYYKDGIPHVLSESELPLVLPEVDKYLPTETGEPPLARAKDWKYKGEYEYEYSTMPGWAGSSWYFLRYMDAHNDKEFASKEAVNYWQNVDLYMGGAEHATGHLLYVRFWTKFLYDLGLIPVIEPAKKLINQGMIQGRSNFVYRLGFVGHIENDGKDNKIFESLPSLFVSKKYFDNQTEYNTEIFARHSKILKENNIASLPPIRYHVIIPLHVDVNMVENDVLNIEAFKNWREEYKNAEFLLEDGKYICGSEVEKMSKSKWNVVSPDSMVEQYGADCLRLYEMFLGPLELSKPWNTNGITGVSNFMRKLWRLYHTTDWNNTPLLWRGARGEAISNEPATKAELKTLHKTIKKITEDIDRFSFNTSVSNFMICVNELTEQKCNKREILEPLAIIIAPYAPHIAEELWSKLGHRESITYAVFPECKEEYLVESSFNYPVSFNGKTRFFQEYDRSLSKEEIEKEIMTLEQTQKYLEGKTPKKVIVVPNKIVNIVI